MPWTSTNRSFSLKRFIDAQSTIYQAALNEITRGKKTSHWMWYIFPQLKGLGSSDMAIEYGISSIKEAQAYLTHQLLGARLRECVTALQALPTNDAKSVFGSIDAIKLRSSLTLFIRANGGPLFEAALEKWFAGQADERTDHLLH